MLHRDSRSVGGASSAAFGLGDLELRAKQFVWSARRGSFQHQAAIQGGLKLPTAPVQSADRHVAVGRAAPSRSRRIDTAIPGNVCGRAHDADRFR